MFELVNTVCLLQRTHHCSTQALSSAMMSCWTWGQLDACALQNFFLGSKSLSQAGRDPQKVCSTKAHLVWRRFVELLCQRWPCVETVCAIVRQPGISCDLACCRNQCHHGFCLHCSAAHSSITGQQRSSQQASRQHSSHFSGASMTGQLLSNSCSRCSIEQTCYSHSMQAVDGHAMSKYSCRGR